MGADLSRIDTVILCGGRGRRLRRLVNDRPKPLASFGGAPFLGLLLDQCARFGLRRFILCAGYKGRMIRSAARRFPASWNVRCVCEKAPRGTGGAVGGARRWIRSDPFLVLNGDSFCGADLGRLVAFHKRRRADISLVVVPAQNKRGRGRVALDPAGRVVCFEEKRRGGPRGFQNAGIYAMSRRALERMPRPPFSLERDFFPRAGRLGLACRGYVEKKRLLDFGTPGDYRRAQRLWSRGRLIGSGSSR
ncbi:MAG: nucleotidyltransferase family protein [Deltaproteobacteria bacterium]